MSAALLAKLIEAGTPADLIAEVAVELARAQATQETLDHKRAKDAERQRRHRESRDVTSCHVTSQEKGFPKVSPAPLPNQSQKISPLNPPIDRYKSEWNDMAAAHALPKIDGITGNRLRTLRRRYAEHGEDAISRAIAFVPKCPHWLGANGWLGNFDSLLRPDNFQRMLEGAYLAKQDDRPPSHAEQLANLERMIPIYEEAGRTDLVDQSHARIAELRKVAA
jgi:hypothetical protein